MHINALLRLVLCGFTGCLLACSSFGPTALFRPPSPYEQYAGSLRTAHLDHTALGIDWLAAGTNALSDSLRITIPYRESGYFSAQKPTAIGYRVNMQRGDKLLIRVDVQGQAPAVIFIDVFELDGSKPIPVASAQADTNLLAYDVRRNQTHLIRIQPELLRSGYYTISITREPLLRFPVQGRTSRQISSYYGEARDGGKRRHEGIDIFAPKGTPALASIDGIIAGVGDNRLGGNVVWLADDRHNQRLYYAHLDRFNVRTGQHVVVGDTVGFVGNTGNARTTAPHLHFGIYAGEGALNPLPFVRLGRGPARQPLLPPERLNDTLRTASVRAFVRLSPQTDAPVLKELASASTLVVVGGTADWLRVELPDGLMGYLASGLTQSVRKPLRYRSLATEVTLLDAVSATAAPIKRLPAGSLVAVLGLSGSYQFVRDNQGVVGWLSSIN